LTREQYAHVLSTFSHASYPDAPRLCLERFDELKAIGLEAFTKKHDPYWDIPLNENLPKPVIDLPIPEEPAGGDGQPHLWQERTGQLTMISPGPLFDPAADGNGPAPARRPRRQGSATPKAGETPAPPAENGLQPASAAEADERAYQELLALLRNRQAITSADAQSVLGLSASALRPLFKRLVTDGHAHPEGHRRGRVYRLGAS
jgi:hypothetical protein